MSLSLSIHICIYTYIYIHTYIHTYIHAYIHTHTHTYIHTYIHTYHLSLSLYMYIYIYIERERDVYIHIHIYILPVHLPFLPPRRSCSCLRRASVRDFEDTVYMCACMYVIIHILRIYVCIHIHTISTHISNIYIYI